MAFKKEKPYTDKIHQGCLNCAPVEEIASMDMVIAVGFGCAQVTKDGEIIFQEQSNDENIRILNEFEEMAKAEPDCDWRVLLVGPLRESEYQRHGDKEWVLIDSGMGFA